MSNLRPTVIEGSILDIPIDPRVVLRFVTNTPGGLGKPIKHKEKPEPVPEKPRDLGEERHMQLLGAIKGLKVDQNASQKANVTEALQQSRDWRR